jgi:peptide chain release factor 1
MKPVLEKKLISLVERYRELAAILSDHTVAEDMNRFRDLSKEYAQLEPLVADFERYQQYCQEVEDTKTLLEDSDAEIQRLAKQELKEAEERRDQAEQAMQLFLLPTDPHDDNNIFLEIRAGTGGDEAAIFAGDLCRMYSRYAETQRWKIEVINESFGEHGGYKEIILRIMGKGAYSRFKFESGVHRVQRVPDTEAQGRIHTSTCTIAVLPELDEVDDIEINPADLRTDTFRASGAGGQHVNKTDSAIRITHIPTGIVVECQDERSQHKNRARALSLLKAKMLTQEREKQRKEQAENRRSLVGTGDRSERIRTYNYPQGRITDHRINLTLYKLTTIMEGDLEPLISALVLEHQADLLATLE